MAGRSRKRGRHGSARALATARPGGAGEARSSQAPAAGSGSAPGGAIGGGAPPPAAPSRSEERNAAARAALKPLAPGERPWPIRIATLLAVLVGGGDLLQVLFGGNLKLGGTHTGAPSTAFFGALMLVCAAGMWRLRYWAVLGFQAILAFVILIFSLFLVRASNLLGFAVAIAIIGCGGFLFYKLVRVLSRLQLPKRPEL